MTAPATSSVESAATIIGVGVIGFGWMGRAHTQAYARVGAQLQTPTRPQLIMVVDDVPGRAEEAARRYGFARAGTAWRAMLDDPEIKAVSVAAPNFAHRELAVALAEAGKHLWIEKPVGVDAADARAVQSAVRAAGLQCTVGFNYRHAPAVTELARLLDAGAIGTVTHASVRMLSDYAADPAGAFSWRYQLARAGHGVLGDLGSHAIDLINWLLGEIEDVPADSAIMIKQRRRPSSAFTGHGRAGDGELVVVENEDWMSALLRLRSGVRVTCELSRVATGRQNDYGIRIHGTHGVLEWDFRRMGELSLASAQASDPAQSERGGGVDDLGVQTIFVGPGQGRYGDFQPGAGIAMSFDDLKIIEADHFLRSIDQATPSGPTIDDAVAAAEVLDACVRSAEIGRRVSVRR